MIEEVDLKDMLEGVGDVGFSECGSGRIFIVSNRLPVTIEDSQGELALKASTGGLATAVGAFYKNSVEKWIGWPGPVPRHRQSEVQSRLEGEFSCVPVFLSDRIVERYYEGFSNKTVWPLFHGFQSYAKYSSSEWEAYVEANQRFLQVLDGLLRPGDKVWIHDYQLLMLPGLLRQRHPHVNSGFFLHIPFPPYEVLRLLPQHKDILRSLLSADLIGFHTNDYARAFTNGVHRALGLQDRMGQIAVGDRVVDAFVHPLGIDFEKFSTAAAELDPASSAQVAETVPSTEPGMKLIFSVSRLDYTKGIPQSLVSLERVLERRPDLIGKMAYVLVVVPSREKVDRYAHLKRELDELVGRINSRFGQVGWTPIRYIYRSLSFEELVSLYKQADVALVTPLRDGMNLIAKEYIATRNDERGVLILSEMAGAAKELLESLVVNPNSKEDISDAIIQALEMDEAEQASRMKALRERLIENPVENWGQEFMSRLQECGVDGARQALSERLTGERLDQLVPRAEVEGRRLYILDYDGTLMPLMNDPNKVVPDRALLDFLARLHSRPGDDVVVLSGRARADLESWLAHTGVTLAAEHGSWVKKGADSPWRGTLDRLSTRWKADVRKVLETFSDRIPGSHIEEKAYSLVWHYRRADAESADVAAKDLVFSLLATIGESPVRIVPGHKSIEVRAIGIGKGYFVGKELDLSKYDFIFAAGDDLTDEDLFAALPESAIKVKVGPGFSKARYRVQSHFELRRLLEQIAPRTEEIACAPA